MLAFAYRMSLRDFTRPLERYRLRDVLPFTGNLFQDYELSVWVYWIVALGFTMLTAAALAWMIDKTLKLKGLQ